jgi:glycosyltransferase involved in cell wall biosynthesis
MKSIKPLRIAFLTPEFVTEGDGTGGLSAYVYRISKALKLMGHEPEVFTSGNAIQRTINFEGIRVERVSPDVTLPLRLLNKLRLRYRKYLKINQTYSQLCFASGMAKAFEKREREKPFDFVQSSDCATPGLFVKRSRRRPLIVRCSWARDLCLKADGTKNVFDVQCVSFLEWMLFSRADLVYAASKFVANHYSEKYRMKVETLRPVFVLDAEPANDLPWKLPKRFMLHFGILAPIKGTDVLAASLPIVWRKEPDFTMVWAGDFRLWTHHGHEGQPDMFQEYSRAWGDKASQVMYLGHLRKPQLYAVLKRAEASVLPSRCDNFPNTAIESLSLAVPVIGTRGASFDELIEPGSNGELIPIADPAALAEAMLKVWRQGTNQESCPFSPPAILKELEPKVAASNLIRLAGFDA